MHQEYECEEDQERDINEPSSNDAKRNFKGQERVRGDVMETYPIGINIEFLNTER
jgi:hypothetical protein